jgi:hypothetical protein
MLRDLTLNFSVQILIFQYSVYVFSVITTKKKKKNINTQLFTV